MKNLLLLQWNSLRACLPDTQTLICLARKHGFLKRVKGLREMEVWLRLLLMHTGCGFTLEETVLLARKFRLARISSVALHKRLSKAGDWLDAITRHMLVALSVDKGTQSDSLLERLYAVDATVLKQLASKGTDWRLHYCVKLSTLRCEHLELTDKRGAEQLERFEIKPGQVVLVDRGYCRRAQAAHVLDAGAHIIMRHAPSNFPLLDKNGRRLDVLAWLRTLRGRRSSECKAYFEHQGKTREVRLCALRMDKRSAGKALGRVRRKSQKNGAQMRAQTKEMSEYVMVLTTLERRECTAAQVLNLYRWRWQVELVFKSLKSLLGMGKVPKRKAGSARAWIQGKIITALIVEHAMKKSGSFSPWGQGSARSEQVEAL
jgi:hypothetical protein